MKIPFLNRPETRAGYTDAIVEALLKEATGGTTASVSSLGVTEACAGLWGRSFASARITPVNAATAALTPAILEAIGRRLLLHGEAVFEVQVDDDVVRLVEASSWEIEERAQWLYRADFATPEGTYTRALTADRVLHPRIGGISKRPWQGQSPIPSSTAKLAAVLETKLTHEVSGPVGSVMPLPHKGSTAQLQADIDKLSGRTVLVESTSGGMGDRLGAPKGDWEQRRIGADPPESMIGLRKDVQASILAACGLPWELARAVGRNACQGGNAALPSFDYLTSGAYRCEMRWPSSWTLRGWRSTSKSYSPATLAGGRGPFKAWSAAVWKLGRRRRWRASWWTMTQARDYAPVLDRLITRIIPGESPGLNPLGPTRFRPRVTRKSRYGRPGGIIEGGTS